MILLFHIRPVPTPRPYHLRPVTGIASGEAGSIKGLWGKVYMWIFDSYFKGCIRLWSRERGLEKFSAAYPHSLYMHRKDPHAHWEMIEGLESRYKVEACRFNSIFGTFEGHRIYASRKVAKKIEIQTRYAAELYNADVRQDQRYLAEKDLFPCGDRNESRFSPDFQVPLSILGMEVAGDPNVPREIYCVQVLNERKQRFEGPEKVVLTKLLEFIKVHELDFILFPYANRFVHRAMDCSKIMKRHSHALDFFQA